MSATASIQRGPAPRLTDAEIRTAAIEYARISRFDALKGVLRRLAGLPGRHPAAAVLAALLVGTAAALLLPSPALAFDWPSFDPLGAIKDALSSLACMLFEGAFGFLKGAADVDKIMADFSGLLGPGASNMATYTIKIANDVVKTCANTVLSIVIMIQLIKIASQIDKGGGTLPAVRDVFQLLVFMAIFIFLVNNAETLMVGLFDLIQQIGRAIDATLNTVSLDAIKVTVDAGGIPDIGGALLWVIVGTLAYVIALVSAVVTRVMAAARAFTIYALTMFAPLAFAFLGMDATRQWGVGYLKNFIAETLSGAVMVVVLWFFPVLLISLMPGMAGSNLQLMLGAGETIEAALDMLVCSFVLLLLIIRSGGIAQKIIGGA